MDKDNFISFYDYKQKILKQTKKKTRKKSLKELRENAKIVKEKKKNGEMITTRETMNSNDLPKLE